MALIDIRSGSCGLYSDSETREFVSLVLDVSPQVLLTPHFVDSCVLFHALKLILEDEADGSITADLLSHASLHGSSWTELMLTIKQPGKPQCLRLANRLFTAFISEARIREVFQDLITVLEQAAQEGIRELPPPRLTEALRAIARKDVERPHHERKASMLIPTPDALKVQHGRG